MVYKFDGFNYVVRLSKGERLAEALNNFAVKTKVDGAWILGIGGAQEVEVGFYDLNAQKYSFKMVKKLLEVTSLQGNFALNEQNETVFHLHGTFSDESLATFGGHVKDLVVGGTLELFIHRTDDMPLKRKLDDQTGLQVLDL